MRVRSYRLKDPVSRRCHAIWVGACFLLATTAAAKLFALSSPDRVLLDADPVLGIQVKTVMLLSAGLETAVCAVLCVVRGAFWRGLILASLGAQFLAYHAIKLSLAPDGPCPCLGSAWRGLGLTEAEASRVAIGMALGILASGVWLLSQRESCVQTA